MLLLFRLRFNTNDSEKHVTLKKMKKSGEAIKHFYAKIFIWERAFYTFRSVTCMPYCTSEKSADMLM